jgi:phospholipase/lecithinase/hemolysin
MTAANDLTRLSSTTADSAPPAVNRRSLLRVAMALPMGIGMASLPGCGNGDIVDALVPNRFVVFGDGMSDVGQTGKRFTINDGTINIWAERVASRYGKTVEPQSKGGLGYARGHGAQETAPSSIGQQIDAFLASNSPQARDVVLLNLPMAEVLSAAEAVRSGTLTETLALQRIETAGKDLVAQVRRLVAAGLRYVVVCGVYDLGKSPFAIAKGQVGFMSAASLKLNDSFKVTAVDMGNELLFVDAAYLVNRNVEFGPTHGFLESKKPICNTPDASTCTDATLVVEVSKKPTYLFADDLHLTPVAHQQLGDYAGDQLKGRW